MNTQRILLLSYIVLGLLLALVLEQGFIGLGGYTFLGFLVRSAFDIENIGAKALGFGAAGAIALWSWRDARVKTPATEVVEELQRVTWPTRAETFAAAWAVIIATLVCAVILGIFDYGWGLVTQQVYAP
jgi:preprotein translocase subunit SecE